MMFSEDPSTAPRYRAHENLAMLKNHVLQSHLEKKLKDIEMRRAETDRKLRLEFDRALKYVGWGGHFGQLIHNGIKKKIEDEFNATHGFQDEGLKHIKLAESVSAETILPVKSIINIKSAKQAEVMKTKQILQQDIFQSALGTTSHIRALQRLHLSKYEWKFYENLEPGDNLRRSGHGALLPSRVLLQTGNTERTEEVLEKFDTVMTLWEDEYPEANRSTRWKKRTPQSAGPADRRRSTRKSVSDKEKRKMHTKSKRLSAVHEGMKKKQQTEGEGSSDSSSDDADTWSHTSSSTSSEEEKPVTKTSLGLDPDARLFKPISKDIHKFAIKYQKNMPFEILDPYWMERNRKTNAERALSRAILRKRPPISNWPIDILKERILVKAPSQIDICKAEREGTKIQEKVRKVTRERERILEERRKYYEDMNVWKKERCKLMALHRMLKEEEKRRKFCEKYGKCYHPPKQFEDGILATLESLEYLAEEEEEDYEDEEEPIPSFFKRKTEERMQERLPSLKEPDGRKTVNKKDNIPVPLEETLTQLPLPGKLTPATDQTHKEDKVVTTHNIAARDQQRTQELLSSDKEPIETPNGLTRDQKPISTPQQKHEEEPMIVPETKPRQLSSVFAVLDQRLMFQTIAEESRMSLPDTKDDSTDSQSKAVDAEPKIRRPIRPDPGPRDKLKWYFPETCKKKVRDKDTEEDTFIIDDRDKNVWERIHPDNPVKTIVVRKKPKRIVKPIVKIKPKSPTRKAFGVDKAESIQIPKTELQTVPRKGTGSEILSSGVPDGNKYQVKFQGDVPSLQLTEASSEGVNKLTVPHMEGEVQGLNDNQTQDQAILDSTVQNDYRLFAGITFKLPQKTQLGFSRVGQKAAKSEEIAGEITMEEALKENMKILQTAFDVTPRRVLKVTRFQGREDDVRDVLFVQILNQRILHQDLARRLILAGEKSKPVTEMHVRAAKYLTETIAEYINGIERRKSAKSREKDGRKSPMEELLCKYVHMVKPIAEQLGKLANMEGYSSHETQFTEAMDLYLKRFPKDLPVFTKENIKAFIKERASADLDNPEDRWMSLVSLMLSSFSMARNRIHQFYGIDEDVSYEGSSRTSISLVSSDSLFGSIGHNGSSGSSKGASGFSGSSHQHRASVLPKEITNMFEQTEST